MPTEHAYDVSLEYEEDMESVLEALELDETESLRGLYV